MAELDDNQNVSFIALLEVYFFDLTKADGLIESTIGLGETRKQQITKQSPVSIAFFYDYTKSIPDPWQIASGQQPERLAEIWSSKDTRPEDQCGDTDAIG